MLELIFQGFMEWAYGLTLECWEYFSSSLLSIMSMDYAYMKSHVPVIVSIAQVLLAVGWALLIGNLVFQALKSMAVGLGFEGEDPKLLFTRTFVFAFLLMASPQICEVGLRLAPHHAPYAAAALPVSDPQLAERYHSLPAGRIRDVWEEAAFLFSSHARDR